MKLQYKNTKEEVHSSSFTISALSEVNVGDDSVFIKDLDVLLIDKDGKHYWKDLKQAFRDKDVIPNNANTHFAAPKNNIDQERGWSNY